MKRTVALLFFDPSLACTIIADCITTAINFAVMWDVTWKMSFKSIKYQYVTYMSWTEKVIFTV